MIDINDYNREDLIASCLMEAASVLSEALVMKNGKFISGGLDADKVNNMSQKDRDAIMADYAAANKKAEERKKANEEAKRKAEEDRKNKEIADRYDALLEKQKARHNALAKKYGRPIEETSYRDELRD